MYNVFRVLAIIAMFSVATVQSTLAESSQSVLFVDQGVTGFQPLLQRLEDNITVYTLDANKDGIQQIAQYLASHKNLASMHIISHGDMGQMSLGASSLTHTNLEHYQTELQTWGKALSETGDILIYGCNVAEGITGDTFINRLSTLTSADIAASNDLTGAQNKGGDWDLEITRGVIEYKGVYLAQAKRLFPDVLALVNFSGLGANDSGGSGFKSMTNVNLVTSNTFTQDSTEMYWDSAVSSATIVIKVDNSDAGSFDVSELNVYGFGSTTPNFDATTTLVFRDKDNSILRTMTLNGDKAILHKNGGVATDLFAFFDNNNTSPVTGVASITLNHVAIDAAGANMTNNINFKDITITNVAAPSSNTTPVISIDNSNLAYSENDAVTQIDSAATLTDADGDADWNGGTLVVQITANSEVSDELSIPDNVVGNINTLGTNIRDNTTTIGTLSDSEGTVTNGSALTITFNASATNALVQQVLRAIHYRNTSDDPGTSNRTIMATATDTNAAAANDTRTIAFTALNDQPTLTATGSSPTFIEGGSAASIYNSASASSVESGQTFTAMTVTVTNVNDGANEVLSFDGSNLQLTNGFNVASTVSNGLNVSVAVTATTATVTFSSATLSGAALQTLVNAITYANGSQNPNTSNRVITITSLNDSGSNSGSNDNVNEGLAIASTVTVTDSNDAPTDIALTATSIARSATSLGADVGTLSSTDADDSSFTYTLVSQGTSANGACGAGNDVDNASYQINSTTLETSSTLTVGTYNICLRTDDGTTNFEEAFAITVTDSTAPTISAVSIPNSAHKVGDTVTVTIIVSSDSDDYTSGSGGISGTINDYTLGSLSKTNNTTYTATFTITDGGTDVAAGSNVAVNFTLNDSTGNTSSAFTAAIVQVSDPIYANLPEVALTTDTSTIAEDGGVATLTATLSSSLNNQWPDNATVNLAYTGTGTASTDYSKFDSITINAGGSTGTATVTGTADTLYDAVADETAIVDISSLSVGTEAVTNQQTITITDAESAPVVTLGVGSSPIAENGGTSTVTASLNTATYANVTVNLAYVGTATSGGTDYNTASSAITIAAGSTSANAITGITSVDDGLVEGSESIIIDITGVSGGSATESGVQSETVTITDDDLADTDGTLTAAGGVAEPVGLDTTVDTVGEGLDLFDFTLTDGATGDGVAMGISQIVLNVSGTSTDAERAQVTWRLNGADASNVSGIYNAGADTITFSGLSIFIADGGSETYTVNAFFNNSANITEDNTYILSVDGDTDVTISSGTEMATSTAISNNGGGTFDVVATGLVFNTQPAGSVSGGVLSTQPVVTAQDAFGNTDTDFTETITLTEASAGSITSNTSAASAGVATFSGLSYTATADQQSFTLTANDDDGSGSDLPTSNANAVISDVVATVLAVTTQPAGSVSGIALTTQPVITARDANGITDTGFTETVTITEASAGAITSSTISAAAGVATFTSLTYTATADQQSFTLTANDDDGVGSNLSTVATNAVTSDVVATQLIFAAQPAPLSFDSGQATVLSTAPVVSAQDANNLVDTGYSTDITLLELNGAGSALMTVSGDSDGNAATVTLAPSSGVATYTGMQLTYTASGGADETFNLQATSGALTAATSSQFSSFSSDADGSVSAASGVVEPISIDTILDSDGEALDIFDFDISDGGLSDGDVLTVSEIRIQTSGSLDASKLTYRLNGADASNVVGNYNSNVITFSGLTISIADAASETYTVNAYYNDNTGLTEGQTLILSVDGGSDLTVGESSTQMGATTAVTNNTGTTVAVEATSLVFNTQPAGSVSGSVLSTQPVVIAQDTFGNTDTDFSETITLTEASDGSLASATATAVSGVATFSGLTYIATADQQSFTLTANDDDGSGTDLPTSNANAVTSDVVATVLAVTTQPAGSVSGTALTTQPVISAQDGNGVTDTAFTETITLTEASAGAIVGSSQAAIGGVATFTGLNYTATSDQQSFTLTANDDDGVGSNLSTVATNAVVSDVVATQLIFAAQPAPLSFDSGQTTVLSTAPVVSAQDANNLVDTGYSTDITLLELNGAGSALMVVSGDGDGNAATVTLAPSSGVATYTGMQLTYTASGGADETFNLQATSGALTTATSSQFSSLSSDSDGSVSAASGVVEPISIDTILDSDGEALDIFDFDISDGGLSDADALTVSEIRIQTSGSLDASKLTYRLNGADANNVVGNYNSNVITFSGLTISIADAASETYTVNAYYNDNTGLTEGQTLLLSIDGDSDLTVGASSSQMGATSAITNDTGSTVAVNATGIVFTVQPSGSVSGSVLTTQPVVTARDAFGNTDSDFTETVTLTESSSGTLLNTTVSAISGVATFSGVTYSASTDQESVVLTANDDDSTGTDLATVDAASLVSDVVATTLIFTSQPSPLEVLNSQATPFTTVPVLEAQDDDGILDTGYSTNIVIAEVNGSGTADLIGTGDSDGSDSSVTLAPSSGVTTFSGLEITYNASASVNETFNLQATSGSLISANSSQMTALLKPLVSIVNISITGATGNGGVFRAGDTVDATWNNSGSGDNNVGVTGVTIDFSQFGGGTAVIASESSGVWSASYALAGSVNSSSRNVVVTATNASGSTTLADTTNATVDTAIPALSSTNPADNSIDISRDASITLNFSEAILAASGSNAITLMDAADDSVVVNVASDSGSVIVSSTSAVITTGVTLIPTHTYYLNIDNGAFSDAAGNSYTGIIDKNSVNFTVANIAPIALDDAVSINEDNAASISVLANDTDSDSSLNAASVTVITSPSQGDVSVNTATGIVTYTPNNNYNGSDSFTYSVEDVYSKVSNQANVNITVMAVNDAPIAIADIAVTPEDNSVSVDVLANDSDLDLGDSIDTASLAVVVTPTNGSVEVVAGEMVYTPETNFNGSDGFTYTVNDQSGASSNSATVVINVTGSNDLPVAVDDIETTNEDEVLFIDVVENDSDIDGELAADSVTIMSNASNGSTDVDAITGEITYTPNTDFNGSDSFTYIIKDDSGGTSNEATVNITVNSVNDAPIALTDTVILQEDTSHTINVLGNDSDVDGTLVPASVVVTSAPLAGSVTVDPISGSIIYTPSNDFNGGDQFAYTVEDNLGTVSTAAVVNITVEAVNDPPVAIAMTVQGDEDEVVHFTLTGEDSDSTTLTFEVISQPTNGFLLGVEPYLSYVPMENFNGTDTFTFAVSDGSLESSVATVTLVIAGLNDDPTIGEGITHSVNAGESIVIDVIEENVEDVDGDDIVLLSGSSTFGEVTIVNGQLVFAPNDGASGNVNIDYLVTDNVGGYTAATLTVEVLSSTAPTLNVPSDITLDANALFTEVDLGHAQAFDAEQQPLPVSLNPRTNRFSPGRTVVTWSAQDSFGQTHVSNQIVNIRPLVNLEKDQTILEGQPTIIHVYLNGDSPSYPVVVNYSVSGTADNLDHDLTDGQISIDQGRVGIIALDSFSDDITELQESIVVTLDERNSLDQAVNLGSGIQHTITIVEGNIQPDVSITVTQDGEQRFTVAKDAGEVYLSTTLIDPNKEDAHTYNWVVLNDIVEDLDADENSMTFNPSLLDTGLYTIQLDVTDDGSPVLSDRIVVHLDVIETLEPLSEFQDSDSDQIPDLLEGYGDEDEDGIPDYLDANSGCSILPEQALIQDGFQIEADPGVCLRKGKFSVNSEALGAQLTQNDIDIIPGISVDESFTNVGGIFDYIATGLPSLGQSYEIVMPQRQLIPVNAVYRKYTQALGWSNFVENDSNKIYSAKGAIGYCPPPADSVWEEGLISGYWCVQLMIEDGGPNDSDGIANGTIVDPGGVSVQAIFNVPVAVDDTLDAFSAEAAEIDVLLNDSDLDGDALTVESASALFGSVLVGENNILTYTSDSGFFGQDTISYIVADGLGGSDEGRVVVNVLGKSPVKIRVQGGGRRGGAVSMSCMFLGVFFLLFGVVQRHQQYFKSRLHLPVFTLLLLSSVFSPLAEAKEDHWHAGVRMGLAQSNASASSLNRDAANLQVEANVYAVDNTSTSYNVYLGYDISSHWGVELGYMDVGVFNTYIDGEAFGVDEGINQIAKVHPEAGNGIYLGGTYNWTLNDLWRFQGYLGVFSWGSKYTATVEGGIEQGVHNDRGTDPYVGLGAIRRVDEHVDFSMQWKYLDFEKYDVNLFLVGLGYRF